MSRTALAGRAAGGDPRPLVYALFLAGSLLPVVAMLAALFAAVWIHEGEREREALASRSQRH